MTADEKGQELHRVVMVGGGPGESRLLLVTVCDGNGSMWAPPAYEPMILLTMASRTTTRLNG